jgi:hypothetical protein
MLSNDVRKSQVEEERKRETWSGKLDFIFSALGYAGI